MLADYRFASRDAEPVFACLAGGTEKLLKLTFGLVTVDGGGAWPSKATMQQAGHKIVELDATVRDLFELLCHTARKTGLPLGRNGVARAPDSVWIRQRRLKLRRL